MTKPTFTKFYITRLPKKHDGFVNISDANEWPSWIAAALPAGLNAEVQKRLVSNLKHVLVGLELKAALIAPHEERVDGRPVLFEPYFQTLIFEFCVGVFSVCEGLGSAHYLCQRHSNGGNDNQVKPKQWRPSLAAEFDPDGMLSLDSNVGSVINVRDKLHQDQVGARKSIDWHVFSYEAAFTPALSVMHCLLRKNAATVPDCTNLNAA